jgi:hypothetical protein
MAVPNYTYLIMVSGSFEQANAYGHEHFEIATTLTNSVELQKLRQTMMESAPDSNEPTSSSAFRPTEDTK